MDISATSNTTRKIELRAPLALFLRYASINGEITAQPWSKAYLRVLDDFEIVYQLEGAAWIYSEPHEGSVDLPRDWVAFIPRGFQHGWGIESGRHLACHFDFQPRRVYKKILGIDRIVERKPLNWIPHFELHFRAAAQASVLRLPLVTRVRRAEVWRERVRILINAAGGNPRASLESQLLYQETLAWMLHTIQHDAALHIQSRRVTADEKLAPVLSELDPTSPVPIPSLAARLHISETSLRTAIRRLTGHSPRAYLELRRIEHAARLLLESDLKIIEVAESAGFADPYHFSRVFKRVMGVSPRNYRRPHNT